VPKIVDNILAGNFALMRFLGKAKPWPGGDQVILPIKIAKSTALGAYSGFDHFATGQTSERISASVDPKQYYASIVVSGIQQAVNAGDGKILDLVTTELESKADDLKDTLGTDFYGDGTGSGSKVLTGLAAAIDDATSVTTYEGISRSTYTNWKSTRTADTPALAVADLAADFTAAQVGAESPTVIITTPAVFNFYEALIDGEVRYNLSFTGYDQITGEGIGKSQAIGTGFNCLYYRGIPLVADEKCTSGYMYMINEKHLWFYKFNSHPKHKAVKNGFFFTGFKEPTDQDAEIAQLLFYGNLAGDGPRFHAVRTGITS
jgi:hypothetical protein